MTDQLLALEATIEMSLCRCQKPKCNSQRCVCGKTVLLAPKCVVVLIAKMN